MTSTIYIRNLRLHAYHGVLPQERIVGNDYVLNVAVEYPIEEAAMSDDVADTMSYADVAEMIKQEMSVQSNLLENVVWRICSAILDRYSLATAVEVDLRKVAPPMSVDCDGAGVKLRMSR